MPVDVEDRLAEWADRLVQSRAPGYERENAVLEGLLSNQVRGVAPLQVNEEESRVRLERRSREDAAQLLAHDPEAAAYLGLRVEPRREAFAVRDIPAAIKFVSNLASSRIDVAQRLIDTYADITVFTPMLVDMAQGVTDWPVTTLQEQIDLHEKISRLSIMGRLSRRPALLLPFVGFDPRSELHAPGTLDSVKDAVESKGFAGVKMYPPMGFWPIGNTSDVDAILSELYEWCEAEEVPVTVHCNRSQGAGSDANDGRSDPERWGRVLAAHPSLRLNLGHFGGVEYLPEGKGWPEQIAGLAVRFAHVYADLGCHTALLTAQGRVDYRDLLGRIGLGADTPMRDRIMYGSDWSMLLQHHGYDGYPSAVASAFDEEEGERLMGGRALDFLGLGANLTANGRRIVDRITRLGADPATWLG